MHNTAYATIDLSAIVSNFGAVRALCPNSSVMAVIKADAYGHGLIPVARVLDRADGFAVARLQEALHLRDAGVSKRILLLGTLLDDADLAICSQQNIDVTAHDRRLVLLIARHTARELLRVWLKLDTGMHRMGLASDEFLEADRLLSRNSGVRELIHMTHFSAADDAVTTEQQLDNLRECLAASFPYELFTRVTSRVRREYLHQA